MEKSKIDIAVLLLFFARPKQTAKVFEQIRLARPSKLFLYQDGVREGRQDDVEGIKACRKIVENIDWECEVHRMYQEKNYGCDPSEYISQKWMFSMVDKGIILEDDDVPSQSFFPYCKELLEKYEHDTRISLISGINYMEETKDCPYSYFFSSDVAIWGWATWKRVIDAWDGQYTFTKDEYHMGLFRKLFKEHKLRSNLIPLLERHSNSGKEYYESILYGYHYLNNCLSIVPSKNMINNIGLEGGTHYSTNLTMLPKGVRKIFEMKRFEIQLPLKHPKYVIENLFYKDAVDKILARNKRMIQKYRLWEVRLYKLRAIILKWWYGKR